TLDPLLLLSTFRHNHMLLLNYHFLSLLLFSLFFFNDTPTTEIYTLSLHDALPICSGPRAFEMLALPIAEGGAPPERTTLDGLLLDRKSTRLNSSHSQISYAVFCLKKKKKKNVCNNEHTIQLPAKHSTDRTCTHTYR